MPNYIFSTRHLSFELSSAEKLLRLPPTVNRVQLEQSFPPPLRKNKNRLSAVSSCARVFLGFFQINFPPVSRTNLGGNRQSTTTQSLSANTLKTKAFVSIHSALSITSSRSSTPAHRADYCGRELQRIVFYSLLSQRPPELQTCCFAR